jgi:hypothetical protein
MVEGGSNAQEALDRKLAGKTDRQAAGKAND